MTRSVPLHALWLLPLATLLGCQSTNHAFRDAMPPHTNSVLALAPAVPPQQTYPLKPETPCDPAHHDVTVGKQTYKDSIATVNNPCIAFLEFDDMGEPFDRQKNKQPGVADRWGSPHQLDAATHLIKDTRSFYANDPEKSPIILVFVHGWKHNASEDDANVQGFEQVIRFLSGQKVDSLSQGPCLDATTPSLIFPDRCKYAQHPIIGVFIGWRGDLFNNHLPVAQDLSYFDREAAGERTGGTYNVTHALISLSTAAGHGAIPTGTEANPSFLLFIGHSFGGLVLERAVSQAFIHEMDRRANPCDPFVPLADLIIYVNTAAAASFSKPVVDILAQRRASFEPTQNGNSPCEADPTTRTAKRNPRDAQPLILSVSTPADAATSVVLPIGQTIGSFPKHLTGTFINDDALACYDPYAAAKPADAVYKQSLFYTHSAPHIEQLRSHDVIELLNDNKTPLLPCPSDLSKVPPDIIKTFDSVPGRCFALVDHQNRCNGTPYWILRTDKSILPDHGTIFTGRFIDFISSFFPKPQPGEAGHTKLTIQ